MIQQDVYVGENMKMAMIQQDEDDSSWKSRREEAFPELIKGQ